MNKITASIPWQPSHITQLPQQSGHVDAMSVTLQRAAKVASLTSHGCREEGNTHHGKAFLLRGRQLLGIGFHGLQHVPLLLRLQFHLWLLPGL